MLGKLNRYMSREQFRTTSDGIITSCLLYCLPLFCNTWGLPSMDDSTRRFQAFTKEDCRKLQVLQNKVLRMKTNNYEKNAPTNGLLEATGDLSVHQLGWSTPHYYNCTPHHQDRAATILSRKTGCEDTTPRQRISSKTLGLHHCEL